MTTASDAAAAPILYHDGCQLCLDIAQTLGATIPALTIIDLGQRPDMKSAAMALGVLQLPSLVVGTRVLPIAPHSDIGHIGAE